MTTIGQPILLRPRDNEPNAPQTVGTSLKINITDENVSDPTPEQIVRIVENSGTLDFWEDPCEDLYSEHDGEPL